MGRKLGFSEDDEDGTVWRDRPDAGLVAIGTASVAYAVRKLRPASASARDILTHLVLYAVRERAEARSAQARDGDSEPYPLPLNDPAYLGELLAQVLVPAGIGADVLTVLADRDLALALGSIRAGLYGPEFIAGYFREEPTRDPGPPKP